MTTRNDIKRWLKEGQDKGATHTIVMVDTFDYGDYPVHVMPGTDIHDEVARRQEESMQRIMEVYKHDDTIEAQLAKRRAWCL